MTFCLVYHETLKESPYFTIIVVSARTLVLTDRPKLLKANYTRHDIAERNLYVFTDPLLYKVSKEYQP